MPWSVRYASLTHPTIGCPHCRRAWLLGDGAADREWLFPWSAALQRVTVEKGSGPLIWRNARIEIRRPGMPRWMG